MFLLLILPLERSVLPCCPRIRADNLARNSRKPLKLSRLLNKVSRNGISVMNHLILTSMIDAERAKFVVEKVCAPGDALVPVCTNVS